MSYTAAVSCRSTVLLLTALVACKGDKPVDDTEREEKPAPGPVAKPEQPAPTPTSAPAATGPRYLRPNPKGELVDAFKFPSVPASIVEPEVASANSRGEVAGILKRFGLQPLDGATGRVWLAKASLVDRSARERLLMASFRGDGGEDAWIVFLGSTEDDRILKIGNVRITAKTSPDAPIEVDARELHSGEVDDVVATWSTCTKPMQKACHFLRGWTMQRGYPEQLVDVTSDLAPQIKGASPPHEIDADGRILKFDAQTLSYR